MGFDFIKCYLCKELKPRAEYYADSGRSPGASSRCKDCEAIRRKGSLYRLKSKRWRERNPEKTKSYALVAAHKVRKDYCESCGATNHLHAHHPDYNKPLETITYCDSCHKAEHRRLADV